MFGIKRYRVGFKVLLPFLSVALLLSTSKFESVEAGVNFTLNGDDYVCGENIICLGDAHIYGGTNSVGFNGRLSLAHMDYLERDAGSNGIVYYKEPIRLLDPGTKRSASFNTSFQFYEVPYVYNNTPLNGDGITFVISANNSTIGSAGGSFGFFNAHGVTNFKSVVVEFDSYYNPQDPFHDTNGNHVSIDIHNVSAVVAEDASELGIYFYNRTIVYVWIEYSAELQTFEVRINSRKTRPSRPFISTKINLANVVEEYMWVGFTGSNGNYWSSYYIGTWNFGAYGIPDAVFHEPNTINKLRRKMPVTAIVVGVSAFVVALVFVLALWFFRWRPMQAYGPYRRCKCSFGDSGPYDGKFNLAQEGYRFTYEELSAATRGFADQAKLGEGGFGCVYRGELPNCKLPVAVKRISRELQQGENEFRAEVSVISQLRHRNLIKLLGWCIHDGKYYIVYDLMPNGSLDKVLFTSVKDGSSALSWSQRFKVIRGAANAVEYLHRGWNQQVIHRDIKASNIMLDEQWNAKLGDFGLARLIDHQKTPNTTLVAGTPGYLAPEAVISRKFTEKSDVFAFGALALEIACGRRALMLNSEPDEMFLVDWVWQHLSEGNLFSMVDERLDTYDVDQMETVLLLGLICSHPDPSARPPMRTVLQVLCGEAPVPSVPTTKPALEYGKPSHLYKYLSVDESPASEPFSTESVD